MSASLAQHERLKHKSDFQRVYDQGKKIDSSSFILYIYIHKHQQCRRLGISVSKKVGNAVIRNHCKRIVREVFRRNKTLFPRGADVVVIVRQNMVSKRYINVFEELCSVLQQQSFPS
jgi:ribonuclease P protein component